MLSRRIALITEQFPPWGSGVARSAKRFADHLHAGGHHVTVVTYDKERPLSEPTDARELPGQPYKVVLVGPYYKGLAGDLSDGDKAIFRRNWVMRALPLLAEERPDVIHAYFLLDAGFLAQVCALELGVPCVIACRGNDIGKNLFNLNKLAAIRWIFERVAWLTFVSEHLAQRARRFFPEIANRSSVVHNGIELADLRVATPPGALPEGPLVGYVGRLGEKKGVGELAAAMVPLRAPLVLVGSQGRGTHDRFLAEKIAAVRDGNSVLMLGQRSHGEVLGLLQRFDVVVQPSLDDGHPNTLLEAMALARPIVASDVFAGELEDGKEGLLVPPGDVAALRAAIVRLLEDRALAEKLGKGARDKALCLFNPRAELESNLRIYEQILSA